MIAVSVSLAALLEVIDTSIVNVALTDMQATLGATLSEIGWVVTVYGIANVIMIPLSAWLGDAFGKKRYFVFAMAGFTLASVLCGLSRNLPMLILARLLQGLMGGGLLAKAQAFLFETFPVEEQGMVQALFGVCVIAGPAIGPTLGGWLTTNYSWEMIFFINLPIGIFATFMCLTFLPKDPPRHAIRNVDVPGIALLVVWVGSLQILLEQGNENDWFDSSVMRMLGVAFVIGVSCFVWRELCAKLPAVDLRVLRHRSLTAGSIYSFVLGMGLYGALFAAPIFAQQVLGYTPYQTGMLLLPGAIASAITMPIMGRFVGKVDARVLILMGSIVLITSMMLLSHISLFTGPSDLFWPMIIRGVGTVMMFLPLSVATFGSIPKREVSAASGFYNLTRQFGGSVGVALLTTVLAKRVAFHRAVLVGDINSYSPHAMQYIAGLTQGFISKGADPVTAHERAMAVIDRTVNLQSSVMSFADTFKIVAWTFVFSIALLVFLGSGRGTKPAGDMH
jgi:DHA2 family multidrug resistance protein